MASAWGVSGESRRSNRSDRTLPGPDGPATSSVDVAALIKQVPVAEALALGADGRLVRERVSVELNASPCHLARRRRGSAAIVRAEGS
jgi:hypothetical protein